MISEHVEFTPRRKLDKDFISILINFQRKFMTKDKARRLMQVLFKKY
jgi:hypothetical protein